MSQRDRMQSDFGLCAMGPQGICENQRMESTHSAVDTAPYLDSCGVGRIDCWRHIHRVHLRQAKWSARYVVMSWGRVPLRSKAMEDTKSRLPMARTSYTGDPNNCDSIHPSAEGPRLFSWLASVPSGSCPQGADACVEISASWSVPRCS